MANMFLGTRYEGHVRPPGGARTLLEAKEVAVEKRKRAAKHAEHPGLGSEPTFARLYPTLVELMTADLYADGARRDRSKLTLVVEAGMWKLGLSEPTQAETGWITAETLQEGLESLERALRNDSLEWRAWPGTGKRKK